MSYSRLVVRFCEAGNDAPALSVLGTEPFAVSCKSTPGSVLESIRQKADRIRLRQRLSGSLADMLVRDPAAYDLQGMEAIPQGVPQDYVLRDVISMAIGFAKDETMPKIDSLSWSIQSEQGSLPVCVFSMLLVLDDGQELPAQGGQDQGAVSALHLLARAAEASDAAAAAKGRPDRTRRKKSTAAAHDADPANTAENEEQFMPAAVSTRAGGARQRGTGMNSKQAAVLQQEPGRGGAAKSAAPGAKGGAKRGASAPITAEGGKWVVDTKPAGKRTLSLEQVKDSPSKAPPGTAPPPTKARKVRVSKKIPADADVAAAGAAAATGLPSGNTPTKGLKPCTLCCKLCPTRMFLKKKNNRREALCTECKAIMHDVYSAFGGDIGIEQLREPVQTGTLDEFLAAVKADVTSKKCSICEELKPKTEYAVQDPTVREQRYCNRCRHYVKQLQTIEGRSRQLGLDDVRKAHKDGTLDTLFVPYGHRRCIKCKAVRENGRFPVEGSVPYRSPTNHHCDVCRSVASPDLASPANAPGAGTMPAQARERMKTRRDRNASASAAAAPEDSRGRTEAMQNIAAALAGEVSNEAAHAGIPAVHTRGTAGKRSRTDDMDACFDVEAADANIPTGDRVTDSDVEIVAEGQHAAGTPTGMATRPSRSVGATARTAQPATAAAAAPPEGKSALLTTRTAATMRAAGVSATAAATAAADATRRMDAVIENGANTLRQLAGFVPPGLPSPALHTAARAGVPATPAAAAAMPAAPAAAEKNASIPRASPKHPAGRATAVLAKYSAASPASAAVKRSAGASTSRAAAPAAAAAAPAAAPAAGVALMKPPRFRWLSDIAAGQPCNSVQQRSPDPSTAGKKLCSCCKKYLPHDEFKVGQGIRLRPWCSSCRGASNKAKPKDALPSGPAGTKRCGICEEHKAVDEYRSATGKSVNEYCSRCMHYVSQLTSKSSSRSKYTVSDIRQAHKDGTLDALFVPLGKKRCSNCTAVLPLDKFSAVVDNSQTRTKVAMLLNLCNDCRENRVKRNDAKLNSAHAHSPRKTTSHGPRSRGASSWGAFGEAGPGGLAAQSQDDMQRAPVATSPQGDMNGASQPHEAAAAEVGTPAGHGKDALANSGEGSDTVASPRANATHAGAGPRAAAADAPAEASPGERVADTPPGAPQGDVGASTPTMHARHAQSITDDAGGSAMDSAIGAVFTEGLGDAAANAAAATAAAAAAAASGQHTAAGAGGLCNPPVATDDAPPGVPNAPNPVSRSLARVYAPHAQSLTDDACGSFARLDAAAECTNANASTHPKPAAANSAPAQTHPAQEAATAVNFAQVAARAVNFAAGVAGPPRTVAEAQTGTTTGTGGNPAAAPQAAAKPVHAVSPTQVVPPPPLAKRQKLIFQAPPSYMPMVPVVPEVFPNPQNPFLACPRPAEVHVDPASTLRGSWREEPSEAGVGGGVGGGVAEGGEREPAAAPRDNTNTTNNATTHNPNANNITPEVAKADAAVPISQLFSDSPAGGEVDANTGPGAADHVATQ